GWSCTAAVHSRPTPCVSRTSRCASGWSSRSNSRYQRSRVPARAGARLLDETPMPSISGENMSRTTYNDRTGRPRWRVGFIGALLALVLVPALASAQSADDKYQNRNRDSNFNLAATPTTTLRVNQYQCGLQSAGQTCTDVVDSPIGGRGFWPNGS